MIESVNLNMYLSDEIRVAIEQRYYAQINEQARLEIASLDPEFLREPRAHVALFSDHGVVHVRDVARQMVTVLESMHNILIPHRPRHRLSFMQGYGVIVAYLHDIGMVNFSRFGRAVHPEYASQSVFELDFEPILETIWQENWGHIAWRLSSLAANNLLNQTPQAVLREMLALSNCHSKSKVPMRVFNDPAALRQSMQTVLATSLPALYQQQQIENINYTLQNAEPALLNSSAEIEQLKARLTEAEAALELLRAADQHKNEVIDRVYADFITESFQWLVSEEPEVRALVADIQDALRVLRCADALRQRGAVLKTSGSYEVFIDQNSGNAVFALRHNENEMYLLELDDPISTGEANITGSELDREGNLRISFERGRFANPHATQRAAYASAYMVNDIQLDVIDSFSRTTEDMLPPKLAEDMQILLEETEDDLHFMEMVVAQLGQINSDVLPRVRIVPCLNNTTQRERNLYLQATDIVWQAEERNEILAHISQTGHKTSAIKPELAFQDVKMIHLNAGDRLVEANTPASFVYIPFDPGIRVIPLGGYATFTVPAWVPLGTTGVIRGGTRNASIVAEQSIRLLMIPKEIYLRYWHHTYNTEEFVRLLQERQAKLE